MSTKAPELIIVDNLSYGWARLFLRAIDENDLPPLFLSISGFKESVPSLDTEIQRVLDSALEMHGKFGCDVSAMTIFPYRHWIRTGKPARHELYAWYLHQYLPRLKARDVRNRNGTYFERMIEFKGSKKKHGKLELHTKNQLEQLIQDWTRKRNHPKRPRQSALQVAVFDPPKDLTGQALRGFPCLQQISFSYDDAGGLSLLAYYPTQYIFDRAYGNYLGLSHLGHFMAHELGLKFVRLNCVIGRPELGDVKSKAALSPLVEDVRRILYGTDPQLIKEAVTVNRNQGVLWHSGAVKH